MFGSLRSRNINCLSFQLKCVFCGRAICRQWEKISGLSNGGLFNLGNLFVLTPGEED